MKNTPCHLVQLDVVGLYAKDLGGVGFLRVIYFPCVSPHSHLLGI